MYERTSGQLPNRSLAHIGATIAVMGLALQGCSTEISTPNKPTGNAAGFSVPYCYDTPRAAETVGSAATLPDEYTTGKRIDISIGAKPSKMTPEPLAGTPAQRKHLGNSVVRMVITNPDGSYRIGTGFKVAPDKVVTSAHSLIGIDLKDATLTSKDAKKAKPTAACVVYEKNGSFVNPDVKREATIDVAVLTIPSGTLGSESLQLAHELPERGDNSTSFRSYQNPMVTQVGYQGIMLGELTDNRISLLTGIDPKYTCEPRPVSYCAAQPGSSGSPLVNLQNEVIGISNWSTFVHGPISKAQLAEHYNVRADMPEGRGSGNYPTAATANTYKVLQYALAAPRA